MMRLTSTEKVVDFWRGVNFVKMASATALRALTVNANVRTTSHAKNPSSRRFGATIRQLQGAGKASRSKRRTETS
jgi:hypothetical protein